MVSAMSIDKKSFRAHMLQLRGEIAKEKRKLIDQGITARVLAHPAYRQSETIFIYYSVGDEISTMEIIDDALKSGKTVCVPRCEKGRQMSACAITSPQDLMEESYGIPEPGLHCTVIAPDQLDLCIIPSLACDFEGHRMGYGGGYYDRFLPKTMAKKMVLCAGDRLMEEIPHEAHDICCDLIVTENEVYAAI